MGLMVSMSSCKKDIIGDENVEEVITTNPSVTQTVSTNVSGIITDEDGAPLANVEITYSREQYTTDENGYFIIRDIKADVEGGILYFTSDGYFDNYKFFLPEVNETSFVRARMVQRSNPSSFNSSDGGTISVIGGGSIDFPQDAIKLENNNEAYTGSVNVYTHWYNPEDPFLGQSMPGDLRGLSLEGQIVQLSTYGMMAVELRSDNNEKLNLRDGVTAQIKFPLPQNTRTHAPEIIETWSLNEQTVYWEEEGTAASDGEFYYTSVSHFSFWNCDAPFPLVNITGKLVNQEGLPLSYYSICIDVVNSSRTGYGWTNSAGTFNGKVPKDEALILKVKNECGEVILEQNIGPFSDNASFGNIVIDIETQAVITGRLQCNGVAVTNGYARICIGNQTCYIAEVDGQGNFTQAILSCNTVEEITIQGFDLDNATISETLTIEVVDGVANVILETCDELQEFIIFKVNNGQEVLITDPGASYRNSSLQIFGNLDSLETSIFIETTNPSVNGANDISLVEGLYFDQATFNFSEFFCQEISCTDFNIEFTTLGTAEDEFVIGTFMGEIDGEIIMGSFKILIDEVISLLECSIETTSSGNCNDDAILEIVINEGTAPYDIIINGTVVTSMDDVYTITGLTNGEVIEYLVEDANGLVCEGREIVTAGGLTCSTQSTPTTCGNTNGTAVVTVVGGSGAYTYSWSDGATTAQITNLAAGTYTVTITDSSGCTTTCSTTVEEDEGLDVILIGQDLILCNPDNSLIFASVTGGTLPYNYIWSNGSTDSSIAGVGSGTYSVTVTDQSGCTGIASQEFEFIMQNLNVEVTSELNGCDANGQPFGTLTAENVIGGEPPYTYMWTYNGTVNAQTINVSDQETAYLLVVDSNGCMFFGDYIFEPDNLRIISGRVWEDVGMSDNIYDSDDVFLEEIEVRLYDENNLNDPIATTLTNAFNGRYIFEDVEEGSYVIQVIPPNDEYIFVETNIGQNDNIDNEFNADGFSEVIDFDGCIGIEFFSAGLRR
jgi:hypothetical protein